jgi:hypothetical protein
VIYNFCRRVYFAVDNAMSKELMLNLASRNEEGGLCDNVNSISIKCYSPGFKYTSTLSVSRIISEYYLSSLQSLKVSQLPPQVFQPNPYCKIETKRPLFYVAPDTHFEFYAIPNSTYVRGQALLGFDATENIYVS